MKDISFIIETSEDDLDRIAASGTCQELRGFFERKFWVGKKILPTWGHLKTALLRNDREMMRLLIIWGAKASARELEALKAEKPDDYEGHLKVLRQCGLAPMTEKQKKDEEVATLLSEAKAKVNATLHVGAAAIATTIQAGAVAGVSMPLDRQMASIDTGLKKSSLKSIFNSHIQQKHSEAFDMKPGRLMPDGTIYLGKYTPKDRDGNSLSQTFNVFAAPEDLGGVATYPGVLKKISKLKNWHGYNGAKYATDKELYKALKNGSYKGEWIIPTRDILHGEDVDGNATFADNMQRHINTGAFADTYITSSGGSGFPYWYWSCTEYRGHPGYVWSVRLSDGSDDWVRKDNIRLSCRPVRFVKACP